TGFRARARREERHHVSVQIVRDMAAVMSAVIPCPFNGWIPVMLPQLGIERRVFRLLHDRAETNAAGGRSQGTISRAEKCRVDSQIKPIHAAAKHIDAIAGTVQGGP